MINGIGGLFPGVEKVITKEILFLNKEKTERENKESFLNNTHIDYSLAKPSVWYRDDAN